MIELNGIQWNLYQGVLIAESAPHIRLTLSTDHAAKLLKQSQAYFLRWVSDWDCPFATNFWYIIKDSPGILEELSSNTRSKVRRGLKNCKVEITTAEYIAEHAYPVYVNAFGRYEHYRKPLAEHIFKSNISSLASDKKWQFWGVWDTEGKLIAYSQNKLHDNTCNYASLKFDPAYLKLYPSYALYHSMNSYYLNECKLLYVNEGARNLSHSTNIQEFVMQKFKFRKAFCRLHVVYSKRVAVLVKILFPLRKNIYRINTGITEKLSVLLRHEEIRRGVD